MSHKNYRTCLDGLFFVNRFNGQTYACMHAHKQTCTDFPNKSNSKKLDVHWVVRNWFKKLITIPEVIRSLRFEVHIFRMYNTYGYMKFSWHI